MKRKHVFFCFVAPPLAAAGFEGEFARGACVFSDIFLRFLSILQNMLVAPVALRIPCLQKSIGIVDVLNTNEKAMILHDLSVDFVCDRLRSFLFRLCALAS